MFLKRLNRCAVATAALMALMIGQALADKVAVITPYLAQPGTQAYLEGFTAEAKAKGWELNVVDTAGDVAAVISRIEDAVTQKVDAIVINVDPAQVAAGLETAKAAGIPVVGMDAAATRFWRQMSQAMAMPWRLKPPSMLPIASMVPVMSSCSYLMRFHRCRSEVS